MDYSFVDIHCHLLPGIDDGAGDLTTALEMGRMAVEEGIRTVIATPHQLGNFSANRGDAIRAGVAELTARLRDAQIPLEVLPGADVRIEEGMIERLRRGDVLTLGDRGKHVLLELPHELYLPLEPVLAQLQAIGMVGVLSHPERNLGILNRPDLIGPLVDAGCLMQVTAGSLAGSFGPASQTLAEQLIADGLVHCLATDAHGVRSRRPLMRRAFDRASELVGERAAVQICCENPRLIAEGRYVPAGRIAVAARRGAWRHFFSRKKAA